MSDFEDRLRSLCEPESPARAFPGLVLLANDKTGNRVYEQAVGKTSVDASKARPLTPDSVYWVASCTKLVAAICALQVVEQGLISLDDDVGKVCPELAHPDILLGFGEDDKPILQKSTRPILFKQLLTHTSGLANHFIHPDIAKWWEISGKNVEDYHGNILELYNTPLVAEPGTQWNYSPGLDWAGVVVARLTKETGLGAYAEKHIWKPLGIKNAAFRQRDLRLSPNELEARWVWMTRRDQGKLVPGEPLYPLNPQDEWGGGALYITPAEYMKVLTSLLCNDGRLLRPSTVDKHVFEPELVERKVGTDAHKSLLKVLATHRARRMFSGGLPAPDPDHPNGNGGTIEYQYSLLGLLTRKQGEKQWTLSWSGLPNLFWWVNPGEEICGMYASQLLPPGDPQSLDLASLWRTTMEERFGKVSIART
ncbi:hypothetical protein AYL99_00183 [Fonsecaea erecta]|uniref:Beta-lactamase-related domain-containing protein n=1 Tax=Fonsecaea erecta TaxID=1367422 RepID=A0A178ZXQ2_9EURO|nr:hypothetical protein AYL99_00183 [Fonsecaea erecta]OAP64211.1 hypothetical protein AYL99_00183 [Fonsecaea erecta]